MEKMIQIPQSLFDDINEELARMEDYEYGEAGMYITHLRQRMLECKEQKVCLWLDDLRNPYLNFEDRVPKEAEVVHWVLNYSEFVQWVEKYGPPDIVSFDHDLATEHYTPQNYWNDYQLSKEYQESQTYTEKTGKDCAQWLVEYCIEHNLKLPKYYVHSANPVGTDNIRAVFNTYKKMNDHKKFYRL